MMIHIQETDKNHPNPGQYFISKGTGPYDTRYLTTKGEWDRSCVNGYFKTLEEAEAMLAQKGLAVLKFEDQNKTETFDLGGAL